MGHTLTTYSPISYWVLSIGSFVLLFSMQEMGVDGLTFFTFLGLNTFAFVSTGVYLCYNSVFLQNLMGTLFLSGLILLAAIYYVDQLAYLSPYVFPVYILMLNSGLVTFFSSLSLLRKVEPPSFDKLLQRRQDDRANSVERGTEESRSLGHWFRAHKKMLLVSLGIFVLVASAFALRVYNLSILDPYTDENAHLVAGKSILTSGDPNVALRTDEGWREYDRSYVVSLLTAGSYWVGQSLESLNGWKDYLFWARLPAVIFGSLAVIPIYLLGRRLNMAIGFLSAFLWTVSPWAIGVSKTIREYAFFPVVILSYLLVLIAFLETLRKQGLQAKVRLISYGVVLLGGLYYALLFNEKATIKIGVYIAGLTVLFYVIFYFRDIWKYVWEKGMVAFITAVTSGLAVIGGGLWFLSRSGQAIINPLQMSITKDWILYFFHPESTGKPIMWWYEQSFIPLFVSSLVVVALLYVLLFRRKYGLLIFFISLGMFLFYVFVFDRYTKPRYIFYLLPFFTILTATGGYMLFRMSGRWSVELKSVSIGVLLLFLSPIFLYSNTLHPLTSTKERYVNTTGEYHDNFTNVIKFFKKEAEIQSQDVFIATTFRTPLQLEFDIPKKRIFKYGGVGGSNSKDRFVHTAKVVDKYEQGYMILDWRRNNGKRKRGFPVKGEFMFGGTWMKVIFRDKNFTVYRWDHSHQKEVIEEIPGKVDNLLKHQVYYQSEVGNVPLYDEFYRASETDKS